MLNRLFEDDQLLVLDKPSGVSVLADRTGAPCLWHALKARYRRPRLVHRIDKGTSGVFLVALSEECQRSITRAFGQRAIGKHYLAVVAGHIPLGKTLTIALPLKRGRKSRYRVAGQREEIRAAADGWSIDSCDGLASITRIRPLAQSAHRTLLAVQALTGRAHQVRVHLAWIGHAIAGDHLYGVPTAAEQAAPRLALHCRRLVVPGYGTFKAAPAPDFTALLAGRTTNLGWRMGTRASRPHAGETPALPGCG